jgi:16S rRNA (uracil1498-N3)-methyltransferase
LSVRTIRIFHPEALQDDAEVQLTEAAAHHVARVLRLGDGDGIRVFDGSGREWPAVLVDARGGRVRTGTGMARNTESPLELTLVQGISRGERMDWTIQKAAELGISRIVPVFTARTAVKLDAKRSVKRMEHWRGIIVSACEQSGRTRLPALDTPRALDAYLGEVEGTVFMLDPSAERGLRQSPVGTAGPVGILVGPEGGLDDAERVRAVAAGCVPVQLGPRVLRTETAGIVAIAALQALYGDLSG